MTADGFLVYFAKSSLSSSKLGISYFFIFFKVDLGYVFDEFS